MPDFDCVVVGLGPVGATLAGLLGLSGLRTLGVERAEAVHALPRAVHFDDETMRVFQTLGVAGALSDQVRVNPGMRFVDRTGRVLLDWPRPAGIGPQGWRASYRFHQPDLETTLRARLAALPGVSVRLGTEASGCTRLGQAADGAGRQRVTLRTPGTGAETQVTAGFVIGCDGARSTVRQWMGATLEDLGFAERWLVVDVRLTRERPDLGDHTIQYCDPDAPATYVRGPGQRRRWEFALNGDDAVDTEAGVWDRLRPWLTPGDAVIERHAVYTFRSLLAGQWHSAGLLLAGDAAHQSPPFMGQGMCAGIRDAANLAWKIAERQSGRATDALLDSYTTERRAHVRHYIDKAIDLGRLINSSAPEAALGPAEAGGTARMASLSPRLGSGAWRDGDAAAGRLGGQARLEDGTLVDDRVGYRAALLADPGLLDDPRCAAALAMPGAPVAVPLDPARRERTAPGPPGAVLVRPDRYVFGVGDDAEAAVRLLDDWRAALAG